MKTIQQIFIVAALLLAVSTSTSFAASADAQHKTAARTQRINPKAQALAAQKFAAAQAQREISRALAAKKETDAENKRNAIARAIPTRLFAAAVQSIKASDTATAQSRTPELTKRSDRLERATKMAEAKKLKFTIHKNKTSANLAKYKNLTYRARKNRQRRKST